jgi:hypothetical protein
VSGLRRSIPAALDVNQFPLTLAGGLRASFADIASESLPDGLTALMRRLDANRGVRIPTKSAGDSERSRPPVPIEAGRGFR